LFCESCCGGSSAPGRRKIEQNDSTGLWYLSRFDPTTQGWVLLVERYTTQADAVTGMQTRINRVIPAPVFYDVNGTAL
jgi:hypothetical protein